MIKVAITGALGRMGSVMRQHLKTQPDFELVLAVSHRLREGAGDEDSQQSLAGVSVAESFTQSVPGTIDVILDFSVPEAAMDYARFAGERRIPMVMGTTGFSTAQLDELADVLAGVPCLVSPNMSLMMNVMFRMVGNATLVLADYNVDVEISEGHHRGKRNAPSDTALKLAQIVAEKRHWPFPEAVRHSRWGMIGGRQEQEIGIQCIRGGDIFSEHSIMFAGLGERLEIAHRAHSLESYARGAVKALRWIINRPPGVYDMLDMLGLPEVLY
ncbi:MAG: 4-hydroxy-tetrahydrodipicolinate reductase [Deltaproteobacteria bacterium]|nr:4-hydroxy-tetrahydrodipicolinate reductase [Candidatus Anaeroferrophillus wilburensis]MBN2888117.1 4-hydroxy-tetrahydrodipicolinate reductase [Deltaproteobacteria bacterium]